MKNIECIFKHNIEWSICSGNFLNDNDNLYLVVNISNFENNEGEISIYDFHQNKIKKMQDFNEPCHMVYIFYDKKKSKNYIISTHFKYIKSYDYENNQLYFKYEDGGVSHFCSEIYEYDENIVKISKFSLSLFNWNYNEFKIMWLVKK